MYDLMRDRQNVRFDCDPNAAGAEKQFKHCLALFKNVIGNINIPSTATNTTETDSDGTQQKAGEADE